MLIFSPCNYRQQKANAFDIAIKEKIIGSKFLPLIICLQFSMNLSLICWITSFLSYKCLLFSENIPLQTFFLISRAGSLYWLNEKEIFKWGWNGISTELDCLKRKLGVTDDILQEVKRKDVDILLVKVGRMLGVSLREGCWECPSYEIVIKHFEEAKNLDRDLLYNNFVCNEISGSYNKLPHKDILHWFIM